MPVSKMRSLHWSLKHCEIIVLFLSLNPVYEIKVHTEIRPELRKLLETQLLKMYYKRSLNMSFRSNYEVIAFNHAGVSTSAEPRYISFEIKKCKKQYTKLEQVLQIVKYTNYYIENIKEGKQI